VRFIAAVHVLSRLTLKAERTRQARSEEWRSRSSECCSGIRGQQVAQEFADIREDRPALFHRGNDGRKIVIGQYR
jgi:hypothetical protein